MEKESQNAYILKNYEDPKKLWKYIYEQGPIAHGFFTTMATSKKDFKRTGGYHTNWVGWGGGDANFSATSASMKYRGIVVPGVYTCHMFHKKATHYRGFASLPVTKPTIVYISGEYEIADRSIDSTGEYEITDGIMDTSGDYYPLMPESYYPRKTPTK